MPVPTGRRWHRGFNGRCQAAAAHLQIVAGFVSEEAAFQWQRHEGSGHVRLLRDRVADAFAFAKAPAHVGMCQVGISTKRSEGTKGRALWREQRGRKRLQTHSLMLRAVGADARLMASTNNSRSLSLTSSGLLRRRWPAVLRIMHDAAIASLRPAAVNRLTSRAARVDCSPLLICCRPGASRLVAYTGDQLAGRNHATTLRVYSTPAHERDPMDRCVQPPAYPPQCSSSTTSVNGSRTHSTLSYPIVGWQPNERFRTPPPQTPLEGHTLIYPGMAKRQQHTAAQ